MGKSYCSCPVALLVLFIIVTFIFFVQGDSSNADYGWNWMEGDNEDVSQEVHHPLPISTSAGFKRVDFLWRKRLKDLEFLVLFLAVTGIPLLVTLAALILTESSSPVTPTAPPLGESTKSVSSNGWGDVGEGEMNKIMEDPFTMDMLENSAKVAFAKDILRVASQSFNLASNTVDLFNTIRGSEVQSGGGGDGGGGDGGRLGAINKVGAPAPSTNEERRSSSIRFVSKLLQLSTTSLGFILQILNY